VDRINGEHAVEAEELSQRVMRISNVLVDKGMLPVQNIHQLPMSARVVMSAVNLVLKRLQEVLVSGSAPLHRTEFGTTVAPVTSGGSPRCSSAFFFILPLGTAVKYVLIYIYRYLLK
jgi:hypothetical protein